MFGYVIINKPELKIKDYECYQEYYCGLCQALKHNHGIKSQLTLNYDLNFVGILLTSLYETQDSIKTIRCPIHPLTKKKVRTNKYFDYVSDMNIVLAYYKLEDNVLDDHDFKSKAFKSLLSKEFKKVLAKYPDKVLNIKENLDKIHVLEKDNNLDLDKISGLFGKIMADILVYQDDIFKDDLSKMGFYLGKYIYLIDAYEDVEKDIEDNSYNPFKERFKEDGFDDYCFNILEMMISKSSFYFEKLPIIENVDILRNIIYSGIWTKFELIKKKRLEEKQ